MAKLTKDQLKQVKSSLIKQLDSFPPEQKSDMLEQINSMSDEDLEEFIIKNNMVKLDSESQESPFRMIASGKLPSFKLAETDKLLAVLEINPVSKGHTLIIPKVKVESEKSLEKEILDFTNKLKEFLLNKLGCKKIDLSFAEMFGEIIINLVPVYGDENINSKRKKASDDELKSLEKDLRFFEEVIENKKTVGPKETKVKKPRKRKVPMKKLPQVPRRIP